MAEASNEDDPYDGKTTAVSKLHDVLTRLNNSHAREPMWRAWRNAMKMPPEAGMLPVLQGIAALGQVASYARAEIEADEDKAATRAVLRHWAAVDELLSIENLSSQWDAHSPRLQPPILAEMLHAHFRLRAAAPRSIPADALEFLKLKLLDAKSTVTSSKALDKTLRVILLELLSLALRAIDDYEVLGQRGMESALSTYAGVFARHQEVLHANADLPAVAATVEATGMVARASDWATKNVVMLTLLANVGQFGATLAQVVLPLLLANDIGPAIGQPQLRLGSGEPIAQ